MQITWTPRFQTGIPALDQQHRELFRRANEFCQQDAVLVSHGEVVTMLDFLLQYAQEHFLEEERWMALYACPAAAQNRVEHEEFVETFSEMRDILIQKEADEVVLQIIQQKMIDWLSSHVAEVDAQLYDYLPVSSTAASPSG